MKKYLITGLIVLMPVALTLMIIFFLFEFFTTPFVNAVSLLVALIEKKMEIAIPKELAVFISRLFTLIFLCIFIFLLGVIARLFLVKNLIGWGNRLISHIPFVKTVYKVSRDIFAALFSTDGKKAFKQPVMIPFPTKSLFCLGFEAGEVAEECQQKVEIPLVSVFTPTAPHPISGFLLLVSEKEVRRLDMTNEDAVKFLVSCGMIHPEKK